MSETFQFCLIRSSNNNFFHLALQKKNKNHQKIKILCGNHDNNKQICLFSIELPKIKEWNDIKIIENIKKKLLEEITSFKNNKDRFNTYISIILSIAKYILKYCKYVEDLTEIDNKKLLKELKNIETEINICKNCISKFCKYYPKLLLKLKPRYLSKKEILQNKLNEIYENKNEQKKHEEISQHPNFQNNFDSDLFLKIVIEIFSLFLFVTISIIFDLDISNNLSINKHRYRNTGYPGMSL